MQYTTVEHHRLHRKAIKAVVEIENASNNHAGPLVPCGRIVGEVSHFQVLSSLTRQDLVLSRH